MPNSAAERGRAQAEAPTNLERRLQRLSSESIPRCAARCCDPANVAGLHPCPAGAAVARQGGHTHLPFLQMYLSSTGQEKCFAGCRVKPAGSKRARDAAEGDPVPAEVLGEPEISGWALKGFAAEELPKGAASAEAAPGPGCHALASAAFAAGEAARGSPDAV